MLDGCDLMIILEFLCFIVTYLLCTFLQIFVFTLFFFILAYVSTKPQVNQFVVRKFISVQDNKAVIPLAVGLVLALLLLMGVIFRLKTFKRRRTKAFLTDDADYLINGMYL